MAEEFSIGHQVEIGLPVGLFTLECLVDEIDSERQLLTVTLLLLTEEFWVLLDDLAENWVFLSLLHREKHFVGHGNESLPVSNWLGCAHPDKPSLEVSWVLKLGHQDTIFLAPSVEHLAFAHVLILPVYFFKFLIWGLSTLHRLY